MKIWNWIKTQLDYRQKYKASLQQRLFNEAEDRIAAKNALDVLAKYEILTASLPADHELSTKIYWKEYADRNLMRENENLRSQFTHLQKTYYELSNKWTDNILRYGVQMYGKWQPIEIAPENTTFLVSDGRQIELASKLDGKWYSKGLPFEDEITHWMPLPELPK